MYFVYLYINSQCKCFIVDYIACQYKLIIYIIGHCKCSLIIMVGGQSVLLYWWSDGEGPLYPLLCT